MPYRKRRARSLAAKSAELAFAAPLVIAHRVARMAVAGSSPSERDRKEFQRMGTEKSAAFSESWNAMAMQAFVANQRLAASLMRSFWTARPLTAKAIAAQWQNAALGVIGKGMAPVHREAVANAKRLGRAKHR